MSYTPQPGTIAHKVVELFKSQPPGTKLSSAEVAETLGHDVSSMLPCLSTAFKHGVLKREHPPGNLRNWVFSLGDGKPEPLPHDYQPDPPLKPAKQEVAIEPVKAAPSIVVDKPKAKAIEAVRFGIFSDGTMTIERGGLRIELSATEATQLAAFVCTKTIA
jgi:hypothetical protein